MSDLISRQAAIDSIGKCMDIYLNNLPTMVYKTEVYKALNDLPSAQLVNPVKHGHWIHDGFDNPYGVDWMHCSECGKRDVYCPATMTNYCSECGARMDGATE